MDRKKVLGKTTRTSRKVRGPALSHSARPLARLDVQKGRKWITVNITLRGTTAAALIGALYRVAQMLAAILGDPSDHFGSDSAPKAVPRDERRSPGPREPGAREGAVWGALRALSSRFWGAVKSGRLANGAKQVANLIAQVKGLLGALLG
jgi:hypothetical protein